MNLYVFGSFRMNAFRLSESKPNMITLNGSSLVYLCKTSLFSVFFIPVNKPFQYFRSLLRIFFNSLFLIFFLIRFCRRVAYINSSVQHFTLTKSDFVSSNKLLDLTRGARLKLKSSVDRMISTKSHVIEPKRSIIEFCIEQKLGFCNQ